MNENKAKQLVHKSLASNYMSSPHEGYAMLLVDMDDLFSEVSNDSETVIDEVAKLAATAIQFLVDCCGVPSIDTAKRIVHDELCAATANFPEFRSPLEGYAIILEELDELWDEIKKNSDQEILAGEAKQVAAMALRFLTDCC